MRSRSNPGPITIGRRLTCLAIVCLFGIATASAQPFRQLTIDDFQGPPDYANGGMIAYTNCTIEFRYVAYKEDGYYRLDFDIELKVNNDKSWMDKRRVTSGEMLTEVLKHEQGHYIIAYLEQQELVRAVGKTVFHDDYRSEARAIFNRIDAKYKQLNLDYDDDTHHMTNREQQHSWDLYFKKRLEFMPQA
jgi:hypothetical protein